MIFWCNFLNTMQQQVVNKFLDSVKIVFVQSDIFCLINFNYRENHFRLSKSKFCYTFLATLVYSSLMSFVLFKILLQETKLLLFKITSVMIAVSGLVYIATVWICTLMNRCKFSEFMTKLLEFDVKLQSDRLMIDYKTQKTGSKIHLFVKCVFLMGYQIFDWVQKEQSLAHSVGVFLTIFNAAHCYLATELVLMLKNRYIILNGRLIKMETKAQSVALGKICTLHHHLSKLIRLFNEIFGHGLLLMFGISFLLVTQTIFALCVVLQLQENDWLQLGYLIFVSTLYTANVVCICHVCYSTIQEVSKSGELIHKIATNDHEIIDKIEMFSLQILNERAGFTAAGFFPIDYTSAFSFVGGVTTYIIILLQLSASLAV
ncbi:gustatory receptor 119 [Tribolium castaneum]|uniref:Gustatory receptor n=1 Tax=Tribolium castaneum TaxID=7070 RepID=D6WQV0_TRICA|nr:gustatory receptor 119 [Tribolium castaneum]